MDATIKEELEANGFEVMNTMERFMNNEVLYMKFLRRLLNDSNYENLMRTVKEKDYDNAFVHAHTLKGVLANLGLVGPLTELVPVVEYLRNNNTDTDSPEDDKGFNENIDKFSRQYENAYKVIEKIFN